jgi:hypothetical protein
MNVSSSQDGLPNINGQGQGWRRPLLSPPRAACEDPAVDGNSVEKVLAVAGFFAAAVLPRRGTGLGFGDVKLAALDRVNIRNVRLMLEGPVVAHPTDNQFGAKINGEFDPVLEVLLNDQPGWIKWQATPGHVMVLGEVIEVPELAMGGPTRLSDDSIAAVRNAIDQGSTDGLPLTFKLDPDDRLRIWMPDRLNQEVL